MSPPCWRSSASRRAGTPARPRRGSAPRRHHREVLELEARALGGAAVPVVAEAVQRGVELLRAALALGVLARGDRRAVARLEVLAEVARAGERRDLEHVALQRAELHAVAEQVAHVLLAA